MRLPILLLLLPFVFCTSVLGDARKRQVPSGWALTVLSNHLHAFEGAIHARNKDLLIKLIKLKNSSDDDEIEKILHDYKVVLFRPRSAQYVTNTKISGTFQIKLRNTTRNEATQYPVTIVLNAASPTGWIIENMEEKISENK